MRERGDGRGDQFLETLVLRVLLGVPPHVGDLSPAAGFDGQSGAENWAGIGLADVDQGGEASRSRKWDPDMKFFASNPPSRRKCATCSGDARPS